METQHCSLCGRTHALMEAFTLSTMEARYPSATSSKALHTTRTRVCKRVQLVLTATHSLGNICSACAYAVLYDDSLRARYAGLSATDAVRIMDAALAHERAMEARDNEEWKREQATQELRVLRDLWNSIISEQTARGRYSRELTDKLDALIPRIRDARMRASLDMDNACYAHL